ncbi:MAG: dockerin type I domain-containing protein [Oscillospiraceae bacterium]|nr:dockerin type I domain-containing protein [Oscillospiraceae bacterium]
MKKTLQTAMTAAMFAASLGIGAETASASQTVSFSTASVEDLMNATTGEPVDVYGPPAAFFTETIPSATTAAEPAAPPVETTEPYYDEPIIGGVIPLPTMDLDGDGRFDARDVTRLKQSLMHNSDSGYSHIFSSLADYNYDGITDKQDLIQMILELTGMPEWKTEDPAVTTTVTGTAFPATETTIFSENLPQPVYGPIGWYDSE